MREVFQQKALIPFIMAGDPNLEMSEELACALIEEGAAALEIGVPFSDSLADGPVIQKAALRALAQQTHLETVFELSSRLSRRYPHVPLILFSYLNPLFRFGIEEYVRSAKQAGAAATLTVDLPPEEASEYCQIHQRHGLKTVFLAAPTTAPQRLPLIAKASTGFIYAVSRAGVTGVQSSLAQTLGENLQAIREVTAQPIAVGFGISNGEQARQVAKVADGVVVGSAFVRLIEESTHPTTLVNSFRTLARELYQGIQGN